MEHQSRVGSQGDKAHAGRRLVNLNHVRQNNIVVTKLESPLQETVFEQEYRQAARVICQILRRKTTTEQERQPFSGCEPGLSNENRLNLTYSEFQTAVPFIGERGSGKTSVMYSVLRRLDNYNAKSIEVKNNSAFWLGEENKGVRFVTLDMIDANVLKRTEDFLGIILSRLLALLEDLDNNGRYDLRELYRKLSELYDSMHNLYWQDSFQAEEVGITGLKRLADSHRSIQSFREFVALLLQWLSNNVYGKKNVYLVIAVDDVDMYQGSKNDKEGDKFQLLQQIYDYLRIPGLVVLLTFNENILRQNCLSHFRKVYLGTERYAEETQAEREQIDLLARQFLFKLFPQEQRIYLPDFQRIDSTDAPNLYVVPVLEHPNQEKEILAPFNVSDKAVPVKEFMLRLIAYKTGVYFDMTGTKKHFFEPRNLRELGTLFQIIYSMEGAVGAGQGVQAEIQAANRRVLLQYIYNQFAGSYLNAEEHRSFQNLAMLPLVRQERELLDRIRRHRRDLALIADDFGYIDRIWEKERWKYSYGELLQNVYYATRIPAQKGKEKFFLSKPYIHCVLASHSILLTDTALDKEHQDVWKSIFGSSIAGRWANDMFPILFDKDVEKGTGVGSISLPLGQFFGWELPGDLAEEIILLAQEEYNDHRTLRKRPLYRFMEAFVLLAMFFTSLPQGGMDMELSVRKLDEGYIQGGSTQAAWVLRSNSMDRVCFNSFNFVINSFFAEDSFKRGDEPFLTYVRRELEQLGEKICKSIKDAKTKLPALKKKEQNLQEELHQAKEQNRAREIYDRIDNELRKVKDEIFIVQSWLGGQQAASESKMSGKYAMISPEKFKRKWDILVNALLGKDFSDGDIHGEMSRWNDAHPNCLAVLPVQYFDMMYNIVKRLADKSYQAIPAEGKVGDVYDLYVGLYQRLKGELEREVKPYSKEERPQLVSAFTESFFYEGFVGKGVDPLPNPYIKYCFNRMIETTIPYQDARERQRGKGNEPSIATMF